MKFKTGDKVRVTREDLSSNTWKGDIGRVVRFEDGHYIIHMKTKSWEGDEQYGEADLEKTEDVAKKLLEFHEAFAIKIAKEEGEVRPMLAMSVGGNVMPMINVTTRERMKTAIELAKHVRAEWIAMLNEGYSLNLRLKEGESFDSRIDKVKETYKHGELEERFKAKDKDVVEIIMVNVEVRNDDGTYEMLSSTISKKTLKVISSGELKDGYLT